MRSAAKAVTIRDIALASGVGVTTVSRALNNSPGIAPETRARVLAEATRLNYQPNMYAKSLRAADARTVAVVVKGPSNPFFQLLYDDLEQLLRGNDCTVSLFRASHDADEFAQAREICSRYQPAAVLFLGGGVAGKAAPSLPVPSVVATAPAWPTNDTVSVRIDDRRAVADVVDHLVAMGHEHIALLSTDENPGTVGGIRRSAFVERMAHYGLHVPSQHIVTAPLKHRPYSFDYGYQLGKACTEQAASCTAVVGSSDVLALGAMRALHDQGISCPDDIAITGFDGLDVARCTIPTLTTIDQPVQAIAASCVSNLTGLIAGRKVPKETTLRGSLRLGESTAKPPRVRR
ncbi:Catabolite control protein A [Corynebacterium choanae]|uniref:Catabolite control protein A n=2 Tax=Corynebacterium choanae TaxID=1862358 RepID=A0A3G6J4D0_9CORY|nr:Catabolite control protein A [Corynebacterium choanae]